MTSSGILILFIPSHGTQSTMYSKDTGFLTGPDLRNDDRCDEGGEYLGGTQYTRTTPGSRPCRSRVTVIVTVGDTGLSLT